MGWEVRAQCSEASLVLWYPEEEEQDPDQACTPVADFKLVPVMVYSQLCFPAHFFPHLSSSCGNPSNLMLVLSLFLPEPQQFHTCSGTAFVSPLDSRDEECRQHF